MTASPDPSEHVPPSVDPAAVAEAPGGEPSEGSTTSRPLALTHAARFLTHPFFLIAIVAWVANFLHFQSFGWYEDDWYYFPTGLGQPLGVRVQVAITMIKTFLQGRPVPLLFETFVAYTAQAFSSITAPYVIVFCLLTATAFLFYLVLRMRFPRTFCTIAALLFVLSPLTTIRQNLEIGTFIGEVFIFVLTAILLRRRRPFVAYFLAILALFSYESVFLLFVAAPFFEPGTVRRKKKILAVAVHLAICGAILAGGVILRQVLGEQRAVQAFAPGPTKLIGRLLTLDLSYSARSFESYLYAGQVVWHSAPLEPFVYLAGFCLVALVVLLRRRAGPQAQATTAGRRRTLVRARLIWWIWNGCALGLGMIVLGFLTIYFQTGGGPVLAIGRDSRFSVSAVPGSCMFVGSLTMLLYFTVWRRVRWVIWAMLGCLLSVLFVYSFVVQDDYVRAWDYQKNLLSQVVLLTPDLEPNGLIVIRTGNDSLPGFGPRDRIASIGWQRFGELVSLKCIGNWITSPEMVFVGSDAWKDNLTFGPDGKLHWTQRVSGSFSEFVVPGAVIVLDERPDGLLTRSDTPVLVGGKIITPRKNIVNLALGKPARQSSTYGPYTADHGVDGHKGSFQSSAWKEISASQVLQRFVSPPARTALEALAGKPGYAGFYTNAEPNPWWEVDLGRPCVLEEVRLYNAGPDPYYKRAASVRVLLSNDDDQWRLAYENGGKVFGPEPLSVKLADTGARYVRLQLTEPKQFHLEQVEVFGR